MAWSEAPTDRTAPYELLDDGFAPEPCDLLVIGCGNILRGDDAVGPVLVRHLVEAGLPDGVRVVDGGTAGMDVAFAMRGASRVVIVDASSTGAEPGTTYRVPAEALADLPPVDGLHSHNLRWDHALSFGAWLLGPHRPSDVTVYLVEGEGYEPGAPLTPRVEEAMHAVAGRIIRDHVPLAPLEDGPEPEGVPDGHRGEHGGGPRERSVGGLPRRDDTGGGGPASGAEPSRRADRTADGRHGAPDRGAAPGAEGGRR